MNVKSIRESVIAGSWYPGGKAALESQIDKFLANAKKEDNSGLISLISPHAGYMYSGSVAAFAYKQLEGMKINTVIIIAPSHHVPIKGASVYNKGAFRTPLGLVEIDEDLSDKLIKENPYISKKELSEAIGISTTAVDKNITRLKKEGLLKRSGPDKGGHWEIVKD